MDNNTNVEEQILDAARKVFLENGYNETTMTMIAEAAGIGRPALYYYYRTKDLLFKAVMDSLLSEFIPKILGIIKSDMPLDEKIDDFVDEYMTNLVRNPRLPVFIMKEIDRGMKDLSESAGAIELKSYFKELIDFYEKEVAEGTMKRVPYIFIMFSIMGQMVAPVLGKNAIEAVLSDPGIQESMPADSFETLMACWKPYVTESLKHLLLVR